jgi:hypothetical protein
VCTVCTKKTRVEKRPKKKITDIQTKLVQFW